MFTAGTTRIANLSILWGMTLLINGHAFGPVSRNQSVGCCRTECADFNYKNSYISENVICTLFSSSKERNRAFQPFSSLTVLAIAK